MTTKQLTTAGLILAIIFFMGMGIWKGQQEKGPSGVVVEDKAPVILSKDGPTIGGPFTLVDQTGTTRHDTDFKGKPMLVYFGYTYCPDICPMGLSNMRQAVQELGGKDVIQPIFITIDPARDNREQLALYAQNFGDDFVMLTGSQDQVDQVKKSYRVHAAKASQDRGSNDYLMDHSSIIYLMDKDGQFVKHFNHQSSPEEIIKGVREARALEG